jgi:hypothetical protein
VDTGKSQKPGLATRAVQNRLCRMRVDSARGLASHGVSQGVALPEDLAWEPRQVDAGYQETGQVPYVTKW